MGKDALRTRLSTTAATASHGSGAAVSEKHAGFIVNRGGATAADVLRLIEIIQKRVLETSGILLEPEIRLWGR